MTMTVPAWPFLLARVRAKGYQLVVAPDFIVGDRDALVALRASPEHPGQLDADEAVFRHVESGTAQFCLVYRVFNATLREYGLGGDDLIVDSVDRPIDMYEGLVLRCDDGHCERVRIGSEDLDRVHALVRASYQRFWRQEAAFRLETSASFLAKGGGKTVEQIVFPPWQDNGPSQGKQFGGQPAPPLRASGGNLSASTVPDEDKEGPQQQTKSRSLWIAAVTAAVVVVGAAAGVSVWRPWQHPPVLRPAGLAVKARTTTSITLKWLAPQAGPLPDRYVISRDGKVIDAQVPGDVTSYEDTAVLPASAYQYQVRAIRGGIDSPPSAVFPAQTITPPASAGRLTGSWFSQFEVLVSPSADSTYHQGETWGYQWSFTPQCTAVTCPVSLVARIPGYDAHDSSFDVVLTRGQDGVYTGTASGTLDACHSSAYPIPDTLRFKIEVTGSRLDGPIWTAVSWTGVLKIDNKTVTYSNGRYVPATTCPATTIKISATS
jgi:hypothetical protein